MNNYVFALDIGTRTVAGILLTEQDGTYEVTDYYVEEHEERSMLDGQIHNVMDVANVISNVKKNLEKDGLELHSVYVAAAGRSLKTVRASAELKLHQSALTTDERIKYLELSAVHEAQRSLTKDGSSKEFSHYHCVGYSVVHYHLDGERIGSLLDQQGEIAHVEVIATFLPKIVVDSLIAALKRADLEMTALTLEPIAAIQVLIPESMRRLNVALVDIGAGTSDIAITADGTVTAYGMVPLAGDELTEIISDTYLLDYSLAEQLKRTITAEKPAISHDILGFETTITYEEFLETIAPITEKLAQAIAKEILLLNGHAPKAIMLIGGGSLTPHLNERIAEYLHLPHNRVAMRDVNALQHVNISGHIPKGPDFVTPIGIAVAARKKPVHYISVYVNEMELKVFEMNELTIGDCIVQSNIQIHKFYGLPGNAYIIQINGHKETIPGTLGSGPLITLNHKPATVNTAVKNGDVVTLNKGKNGASPNLTFADYFGTAEPFNISYEGESIRIEPTYKMNGHICKATDPIIDNAQIEITTLLNLKQFIETQNLTIKNEPLYVYVDGQRVEVIKAFESLLVNGEPALMEQKLSKNDVISIKRNTPLVTDLIQQLGIELAKEINVTFDNEEISIRKTTIQIKSEKYNRFLKEDEPLTTFDKIIFNNIESQISFTFQDIFRYIEIDLTNAVGRFTLKVNNEKAGFDTPIQNGDALTIQWAS